MNYRVWTGTGHTEMPLAAAVEWVIDYNDDSPHILGAIVGAIVAHMREAGAVDDSWIEKASMGTVRVVNHTQEPPQCP